MEMDPFFGLFCMPNVGIPRMNTFRIMVTAIALDFFHLRLTLSDISQIFNYKFDSETENSTTMG